MRLGREVHDDVDPLARKRLLRELDVADVALDEDDPVLDVDEARAVAGVRQQVVGDDVVVRVLLEPVVDEVRADEAGPAGDEKTHRAKATARLLHLAPRALRGMRAGLRASAEGRGAPARSLRRTRSPGGARGGRAPRS